MSVVRILSTLPPVEITAVVELLLDIVTVLEGANILRTKAQGRFKAGAAVPAARIVCFWYVNGDSTVILDNEDGYTLKLKLEDGSGTRLVQLTDVLGGSITRAKCMDPRLVAAAIAALCQAIDGVPVERSRANIDEFCDACAETLPAGVLRGMTLRTPSPFDHAKIHGHDQNGIIVVRESAIARRFALDKIGRWVGITSDAGRKRSWGIARVFSTAQSKAPDPISRLRLTAIVAQATGPLFDAQV